MFYYERGGKGELIRQRCTPLAGMLQVTFLNHFKHNEWQHCKNKNYKNISLLCFDDDSFRLEQISAVTEKTFKTALSAYSGHCLYIYVRMLEKDPACFFIPQVSHDGSLKNQADSEAQNPQHTNNPCRFIQNGDICPKQLPWPHTALQNPFNKLPN